MRNTIDLITQYHNAVIQALLLLNGHNLQNTQAYRMLNELAKQEGGYICESTEEFQSAFNAEMFSVHTHQVRIIE